MPHPALVLFVRFQSELPFEEVTRLMRERAPLFRALAGLQQKYYLHDPATDSYCGLYLWESKEAFDAYRQSELRSSIAAAYRAKGEPRVEIYDVLEPLRA